MANATQFPLSIQFPLKRRRGEAVCRSGSTRYSTVIECRMPEGLFRAGFCVFRLSDSSDLEHLETVLDSSERARYDNLKYEKRKKSYLAGRFAAKHALAALFHEKDLSKFRIGNGIFNQPTVSCEADPNVHVSITHCDKISAAISFPESHPMGIDVEKIDEAFFQVLYDQMTEREKDSIKGLQGFPCSGNALPAVFWTAKEALSKTLKTGLTTPLHVFELERIEEQRGYLTGYFRFFSQYKVISMMLLQDYVCSVVFPRKTDCVVDVHGIRKALALSAPADNGQL